MCSFLFLYIVVFGVFVFIKSWLYLYLELGKDKEVTGFVLDSIANTQPLKRLSTGTNMPEQIEEMNKIPSLCTDS